VYTDQPWNFVILKIIMWLVLEVMVPLLNVSFISLIIYLEPNLLTIIIVNIDYI
jgi:hypothetical protein